MRNYKEAYERISKLDWFRVGVHNSYILDIMPDDKKDDAKEWLEEDIYDDELMNLNRHVLTKYIRNKDVSDYFMCLRFGVDDLSYLIHRGYVDIEEKIESLIWMEKQLNVSEDISKEYEKWSREEFDKAHSDNFLEENCSYFRACLQMTRILYEKVYSLIYGNHDNLLFVIEDYVPKSYDRQEREMFDFHWRENDIGIFKNMRDVMTWFDDHYDGLEDWSYYRYLLSVYSLEAEKPVKIIEGNIEVIDDKLSLYRIYISGDRYSDNPEEDKVICNTLGISSGMLNFYYEVLEYTPFDIEGLIMVIS